MFNFELTLASEMLFGVYSLFAYTPIDLGKSFSTGD